MKKIAIVLAGSLLLAACSSQYSSTGEALYMKARNSPMLLVPPPLSTSNISSFYILPEPIQSPKVSIVPEA